MGVKYTSQSSSGYDANSPPDDGTQSEANKCKWSGIKDSLTDVLKLFTENINTELLAFFDFSTNLKSGAYTTLTSDNGKVIQTTSSPTITLGATATMTTGYVVTVKCVSGTTTVDSSEDIDGSATDRTLEAGDSETYRVNSDATEWLIESSKGIGAGETVTLTNKTLTAPVINALQLNGAITGNAATTNLSSSAASDEYAYANAIKSYIDTLFASIIVDSTSGDGGFIEFKISTGVGIQIAWGTDAVVAQVGTVTFANAFSAAPWSIVVGAEDSAPGGNSATAHVKALYTSSGFSYGTSTQPNLIHYVAIGPTTA